MPRSAEGRLRLPWRGASRSSDVERDARREPLTIKGDVVLRASTRRLRLQLLTNFDGFVTFPPPIGDQFVQQDRPKIYRGDVSYMIPGNVFGFDAQNTVGIRTRTDDIHIDLAETTGRVGRFTVRDDRVIAASGGLFIENRIQWLDKWRLSARHYLTLGHRLARRRLGPGGDMHRLHGNDRWHAGGRAPGPEFICGTGVRR